MTQNMYANMHSSLPGHTLVSNQLYPSYATSTVQPEHPGAMDDLTDAFNNIAVRSGQNPGQDGSANGYLHANSQNTNPSMASKAGAQFLYHMPDGSYAHPGHNTTQANYHYIPQHFAWPATHYQAGVFQNYPSVTATHGPNTPRGQQWTSSQNMSPVPELMDPRRASWSSKDETSPHTPNYAPGSSYPYLPGQSPTSFSTPSLMSAHNACFPHIWKTLTGEIIIVDFWELMVTQEPSVPEPVPALRSGPDGGRGTLDKILDNRDGTTNVYVRGLQPDTSDEMLKVYGEKFGEVDSCKSIIDASTNHCKGFGFIKYHNYVDAENCIRGFYHRGYEAKFARKSHNSRLKDLASPSNTNLYVSNLPRLINEEGLKLMFQTIFPESSFPNHQAGSCKILKDSCGVSRGVGFARFETPAICQEIIDTFNNRSIGEGKEATVLQIRYADTEEQKQLKAFTAVKRQFKADEYNEAVYGVPFSNYSPTAPSYQSPLQGRAQGINGSWINQSPASSTSPASLSNYQYSVLRSRQPSNIANRMTAARSVVDGTTVPNDRHQTHIKIESPSVTAAAKKAASEAVEDGSTDSGSSSRSGEVTLVDNENVKPTKSFKIDELVVSPAKSKL